jgi:CheY-like chemotaxis protein
MTKTTLPKTLSLQLWVRIIGILLVILFAFLTSISYWTFGPRNIEFCLFLGSLIGAVGVLLKKELARRALIAINGLGLGYIVIESLWISRGVDTLTVLFGFLFLSIIVFYRQPFVKIGFMGFTQPQPAHSWNILLIDDDKILLKMMGRNFFQKGITLLTAESGERGLSIAQRNKLDLIILDVILPGMKGREVCQRLKEDSRTRDIPIMFLTVKDSHDDIQAEMDAGAVSHLTKPVDFPALYKEIRKILGE